MKYLNKINYRIDKNSPEILTAFGVVGLLMSVGLAIKATIDSMKTIQEHEQYFDDLTKDEKFKLVWFNYLPALGAVALTTVSIVGSNRISADRLEGMTSLYLIAKDAFEKYQQKTAENFGVRKSEKVEEDIVQDILNANEVPDNVFVVNNGTHLCYDSLSGRYFYHDIESIRRLENKFNQQLLVDMYMSLNDWYYEIGLEGTELGRNAGFNVEHGNLLIKFTSKIAPNGAPCIVLEYNYIPRYL